MAGIERGYGLNQGKSVVEKYKKFNKLTRNIGVGVFAGALAFGSMGIASVAALSVMADQGQIMLIDKYQNRKRKVQAEKIIKEGEVMNLVLEAA